MKKSIENLPVIKAKKIQECSYEQLRRTEFYDETGKLVKTIPWHRRQPNITLRTIEIDGVLYRIEWQLEE